MTRHDNFHSALVAWLKVLLPLLALAILSTLFLVSRTIDPSDAIPFARVDIDDRIREPRLTQPTWAGVTDDGSALTIAAADARPQQSGAIGASASQVVAELKTPDGGSASLTAARGMLDQKTGAMLMDGGVTISTSTGYHLQTDALTAKLDRTSLVSQGAVEGDAPAGHISAGQMEITQRDDGTGQYLLVFKNGVKLLYQPKRR
ncbi:hypothetical protein [Pseudorhodobacter sp.]|uniref:hypothetical protein n=1 Tax=Pseudorhodobacter sp. TaxID=1934400 RepID=UPI002648F28C|nr:hypothetical protein [Pseudorhodobacter sp.]MDN5785776.1 hypothetical protein [Pseudorhodobacter sp.]